MSLQIFCIPFCLPNNKKKNKNIKPERPVLGIIADEEV